MIKIIGKAIAHYLKVNNMTQSRLSELTDISPSAINQYVKGTRNPSDKNLEAIAKALQVPFIRLKEMAESFKTEIKENSEPYIDEGRLRRRVDLIYSNNDLVMELSKNVLLSVRIRLHDVLYELTEYSKRPGKIIRPDRIPSSPISSITERVLRDFLTENLDIIAERIEYEMRQTELTTEEILENLRSSKNNDYY